MPWQTQNMAAGKVGLAWGEASVVLGTSVGLLGLEPPSPKSLPEDVTLRRFPGQEELRQPPALPGLLGPPQALWPGFAPPCHLGEEAGQKIPEPLFLFVMGGCHLGQASRAPLREPLFVAVRE